jgi:hypothetical protein
MTTTPSDAGRAAAPEQSGAEGELRRLSSEGTVWWRSIFPTVFTVGVGIAAMGIIMEWWGRSPSTGVKIMLGLAWMAGSILFALFGRSLHDVWLAGDRLIVNGANGRAEIHLEDMGPEDQVHQDPSSTGPAPGLLHPVSPPTQPPGALLRAPGHRRDQGAEAEVGRRHW